MKRKPLIEGLERVGSAPFALGNKVSTTNILRVNLDCGHKRDILSTGILPEYVECKECDERAESKS